jgi:thymidine phosphorylase
MSKKIAEGTGALVLDVKVGSGAFMKTVEQARELATTMVGIGNDAGVTTRALLTAMDVPLGRTAGNALEVQESIDVLSGGGPADVVELTITLAREMLEAAGASNTKDPAAALQDGSAMDVWRAMISAQGGDPAAVLPTARETHEVLATSDGYLTRLDALAVGMASWRLGAGRARKEDAVQFGAGIQWHVGHGESVFAGQKLFTLHTDESTRFASALEVLTTGYEIGSESEISQRLPLIIDRVL